MTTFGYNLQLVCAKKKFVEKKGWHPLPLFISPLKELVVNTHKLNDKTSFSKNVRSANVISKKKVVRCCQDYNIKSIPTRPTKPPAKKLDDLAAAAPW